MIEIDYGPGTTGPFALYGDDLNLARELWAFIEAGVDRVAHERRLVQVMLDAKFPTGHHADRFALTDGRVVKMLHRWPVKPRGVDRRSEALDRWLRDLGHGITRQTPDAHVARILEHLPTDTPGFDRHAPDPDDGWYFVWADKN